MKKKSNTTKKMYNKKKSRKVLRKKHKHVKSQKGGFRVKLSRKQLSNLFEVRGIDNRQCVAASLNILGLPPDAIKQLSMVAAGPDISRNAAMLMDNYVYLMWQQGRIIERPSSESVSFVGSGRIQTNDRSYKDNVERFINSNIQPGHITLMLYSTNGGGGHAIVIGRTARAGTIFIIDAQTYDDLHIPYTFDTCKGGIKKGDEALDYLISSGQDVIELFIPKYTVLLDSAEPSLREGRIAVNPQPYNISTASMVGEQDGGPFGGRFGSHVSQQSSYTPIFSQLAPQSAFPAPRAPQSAFPAPHAPQPPASPFTLPAQPPASQPAQPGYTERIFPGLDDLGSALPPGPAFSGFR